MLTICHLLTGLLKHDSLKEADGITPALRWEASTQMKGWYQCFIWMCWSVLSFVESQYDIALLFPIVSCTSFSSTVPTSFQNQWRILAPKEEVRDLPKFILHPLCDCSSGCIIGWKSQGSLEWLSMCSSLVCLCSNKFDILSCHWCSQIGQWI